MVEMVASGDQTVVSNLKLERMLSMKGGVGESSYANNSQAQAKHARSMMHLLVQTLERVKVDPKRETAFVVVDLGCSSGSNTLYVVDAIVNHMTERFANAGAHRTPEFSAFFSDLPGNDFNTLFQLLPPKATSNMEDCLAAESNRSYFAAGVPGSFYRRLFPARSVDVFHSAFSLHWLSQVPECVLEKKSSAYNKGKVYIHGASIDTANAYKKQFQSDLASFLRARSLEIKSGGTMFLVCLARTAADPTDQGGPGLLFGTHFQDAWDDLVHEGLITSEKRDTFNIPVYASSLQDFKEVVEANGSFTIDDLRVFKGGSPLVVTHPGDPVEVGRALSSSCKSVAGVLVEAHIGEQLSEELFTRVERRGRVHAKELVENLQFYHIVASLSFA